MIRTLAEMNRKFQAERGDAGRRLDQFLAMQMEEVSRSRVQELIEAGDVLVDGNTARAKMRLRGTEAVSVSGETQRPAIKAEAEALAIEVVREDAEFAVVNKPAGMMVHAGAGDVSKSRGTLVNAMLHRFQTLSGSAGDPLRPGIVHRLDRDSSGLVIVAKTDFAHRKLAEQFQQRTVEKKYIALVHGILKDEQGTVDRAIARDRVRRTRMTAKRTAEAEGARRAVSHYRVMERLQTEYGAFTLVEVKIETGRTHQIRVHMAALHHPVVGDTVYGAAKELTLGRNFLHAAELAFDHPRSGAREQLKAPLPPELEEFLARLRKKPAGI